MPSKLMKITLVISGVLVAAGSSMASASAEVISMAPHEKSFASPIGGNIMVGSRDETINRIAPLNQVATTREAFVTTTAYGQIDAAATGKLQVGYHVGCAVTIGTGTLGATPDIIVPLPLGVDTRNTRPNAPNLPDVPNLPNGKKGNGDAAQTGNGAGTGAGTGAEAGAGGGGGQFFPVFVNPNPVVTVNLQAGEVAEVALAEKDMIPGKLIQTVVRDFHIKVNTCTGPVTLRQFAYVYASSPEVDDSGAVFGDPTWL
ncbi:MspA family porin [Nocardia sp. R16R-3T]